VSHTTDWREKGVARVNWCNSKFLEEPLLIRENQSKPCGVCCRVLSNIDRAIVEGGFVRIYLHIANEGPCGNV